MLGRFKGCHENAKKVVPTLPDLGGCNCHDPSNAMKAGLNIMMPDMTKLYKSIYANLEKHSIVKNRLFREIGEELEFSTNMFPNTLMSVSAMFPWWPTIS